MTVKIQEPNQGVLAKGYIDLANLAITKGKVTNARIEHAQEYYARALKCFQKASPDEDLPIQLATLQEAIDHAATAESLRMSGAEASVNTPVSPLEISRAAPAPIQKPAGVRNCWANSLLQMIVNAPACTQALLQSSREEIQPIVNLIRIYAQKQGSMDLVPASVGQAFRDASPTASKSFSNIEDPKDVLEHIIKLLGFNFDFEQEFTLIASGSKITDRFSLIRNDELKGFQPVGCVIQIHSKPGEEHFAALEKKPDGWHLIDDNKVTRLSEEQAQKMLHRPTAYLFHYQKVEAAPIVKVVPISVSWKMWLLKGAIAMTASSVRFVWHYAHGLAKYFTSTSKKTD